MQSVVNKKDFHDKVIKVLFSIGVFLLIVIPKGGIKFSGIPLTWGYIYLGFIFIITLLFLDKQKYKVNKALIISYLTSLPFVFYITANFLFRGYDGTLGNLIAIYISFFFLPFLFYLFLSPILKTINITFIEKKISSAIFLVACYGIVLFFIRQIYGHYIEIPYFTVNGNEIGDIGEKYNNRGGVYKLISTYNNGNIYGVCTLMLFPVFYKINKSKIKNGIIILALLLTLSRTVWMGLIFYFIVYYRKDIIKLIKIYFFVGLIIFVLGSILMSSVFQYGSLWNFILDSNLGGRLIQLRKIDEITLFGSDVFKTIDEIVYLSIFRQLGIVGLFTFCLLLFTPIFLSLYTKKEISPYFLGSLVYLFLCFIDGAMLYIPTLTFFFFVTTMSLIPNQQTNNV